MWKKFEFIDVDTKPLVSKIIAQSISNRKESSKDDFTIFVTYENKSCLMTTQD